MVVPPELRSDSERETSIIRAVGVVEITVNGQRFIPFLHNQSRQEWELPGGEVQIDLAVERDIYEQVAKYQREEHGLQSAEEIQTKSRLFEDILRQRFTIRREIREELGIDISNASISLLPHEARGPLFPTRVTGGTGRSLEIISVPFVLRLSLPTLPSFTATSEHDDILWLHWPEWGEGHRQMYLSIIEQIQNNNLGLKSERDTMYSFDYGQQPSQSLTISAISQRVFLHYLYADYMDDVKRA